MYRSIKNILGYDNYPQKMLKGAFIFVFHKYNY